jgi:hypothetical protein
MASRHFAECCLLGGCCIAALTEGPWLVVFGICAVVGAECAIGHLQRKHFLDGCDRRARRKRR